MMLKTLFAVFAATATATIIPPSTGPYGVSRQILDFTDTSRDDPYNTTHKRRVLATTYLPTEPCNQTAGLVDYLPPITEAAFMQYISLLGIPGELLQDLEIGFCGGLSHLTNVPLVVLQPGLGGTRLAHAVQAKELASRGYAVLTVDHPYEALVVEFPDGAAIWGGVLDPNNPLDPDMAVEVRADDIQFVLDSLPADFGIDTSKIIAIGHSLGGWTSAVLAHDDERVLAGIDFDGLIRGDITSTGVSKPFILVGPTDIVQAGGQEGWADFYANSEGAAKLQIGVDDTEHNAFMDGPYLLTLKDIPEDVVPAVHAAFGSIDGQALLEILTGITVALAEFVLEGDSKALKELDAAFEDVVVVEAEIPC